MDQRLQARSGIVDTTTLIAHTGTVVTRLRCVREATPPSQLALEGRQSRALVLVVHHHEGAHPERRKVTVAVVVIMEVVPLVVVALAAGVIAGRRSARQLRALVRTNLLRRRGARHLRFARVVLVPIRRARLCRCLRAE